MATLLTVETQALRQRLQALEMALVPTLAQALYTRAQRIVAQAREGTPVVSGNLRASGLVYPPVIEGNTISVTFGFGGMSTPYAAAVHWNPRSGHTGGISPSGRRYPEGTYSLVGGPYFLSNAVAEVQANYAEDVSTMMRALLTHGVRPQGD